MPKAADLDLGGTYAFVLQASAPFVDLRRGGGHLEIGPSGERSWPRRRLDLPEQALTRLLAEKNGR